MKHEVNLVQGTIYGIISFYGEHLQDLVHTHQEKYTWAAGHLSDIGIPAMFVVSGQLLFRNYPRFSSSD